MRINKEKTYIMIGTVLIQCGACMIHFGLGIILLGAWFLIGSYLEFEKSIDEDDIKDLNEAAKHYLYDDVYVGNPTDEDCIEMFKAGANWRKQQIINKGAEWLRNCLDNGMWVDQFLSEKDKEAIVLTYKENMEEEFKL